MTDDTSDTPNEDDRVGYGKPPRKHRWQKGQSGNMRGRPKESQSFAVLLRKRLSRNVRIKVDGVPKTVSTREAMIERLVAFATSAGPRELLQVLAAIERYMPDALAVPPESLSLVVRHVTAPGSTVVLPQPANYRPRR